MVCAAALPLVASTDAFAATAVTVTNPGKLTAVGPVNTLNGFPAWYQDSNKIRIEPCLDQDNPMCGFLPGDVPNPGPIVFPTANDPGNFPEEFFYQLVDSTLALPSSAAGKATLTLGLEGAFANGAAAAGDQQVFARTRIVVKGGPPNTTLTFTHPFGTATVDLDATGAGKLVEDKTPAVGNFTTPLQGNFGPFLTWDTGTVKDSTGEYAGDPNVAHKVTGGLNQNLFSVTGGGLNVSTDQFNVSGKIATNTGVKVVAAIPTADKGAIDVFATSIGEQLQVEPLTAGGTATPMLHDASGDRFYARVSTGGTLPTNITVDNIADTPVSKASVPVQTLTVTRAVYDGGSKKLTVDAVSTNTADTLSVTGYGAINSGEGVFTSVSPPAVVEVTTGTGSGVRSITAPVTITNGVVTVPQPPTTPTDPGPGPGPGTTVATPTGPTGTAGVTNVNLSWGAVAGATRYQVKVYDAAGTALTTEPVAVTGTGTAAPLTTQNIVGLTANTTYQFTVTATTTAGTSPEQNPKFSIKTTGDTVTITTARYKTTDFRVVGTTSATGGSVSVYGPATPGGSVISTTPITGMVNVPITSAAPAAGGAYDARLRTGVPANPGKVWVKTSNGAVTGPFTVT